MTDEKWSPLTRLRIELLESHAEGILESPFPETAFLPLGNSNNLMVLTWLCRLYGSQTPTEKAHVLMMLAWAITLLEDDNGQF